MKSSQVIILNHANLVQYDLIYAIALSIFAPSKEIDFPTTCTVPTLHIFAPSIGLDLPTTSTPPTLQLVVQRSRGTMSKVKS